MSSDSSTGEQLNDFTENLFEGGENFRISLTKDDNNKSIEREAKLNCKILKISSDFNIDEVFAALSALDPVEYPNLFIFIIEIENLNFIAEYEGRVQESLVKFDKGRPWVIQMTCAAENSSKFYYKAENSTQIIDIDQQFPENLKLYEEWQNKLRFLVNGVLGTIESEILKKLSFIQDSSLILRFLRTLNLQKAFFGALALKIAKYGTKKDLLAILDAPFEGDGRILNSTALNYLRNHFDGDESGSESSNESYEDAMEKGSDSEDQSDESEYEDAAMEISSESSAKDSDSSVLLKAIKYSNKEVIGYLRKQNIKNALQNVHKSVLQCSSKSLVHNRRINKEQEANFRENIVKWLKDVHKIAPKMLVVAASCEHLKIIFDFESYSVENASLDGLNVAGLAYSTRKSRIFIEAKFSNKAQEQKIKGVLAHELCHYVMKLVYENQEFPYHKDDKQIAEIFEEITNTINMWPETKSNEPDDACDEIISTVFTLYQSEDFESELIVRVVNILAQYDENNKSKYLQEKYKILFNLGQNHVISDMRKCFQKNKEVLRLNGNFGFLSTFSCRKIELKGCEKKGISNISKQEMNNSSLMEPLCNDLPDKHQESKILKNFGEIIDDQPLNLLGESQEICINLKDESDSTENDFEFLYQARKFVDKSKCIKFTLDQLLSSVKNEKYVLVSNSAGAGKSWTMKNIANILREETLNRTDREFVRQELKQVDENILHNLAKSQNFSAHKAQRFFEISQEFLTVTDIFELTEVCNRDGLNILGIYFLGANRDKFKILWMQIQNFYSSQQLSDKFNELVKHNSLLHTAASCNDFDYFKTFWELLLKAFGNTEELKNMILQKNMCGNNVIHLLVINSQLNIIEFTIKSLKENFTESQYKEIFRTRGQYNRNLLQIAASHEEQAETFKILWNEVKNFCESNEKFLEILEEVDVNGSDVFNIAASFSTGEIFEFIETELEKIASKDEIRNLLRNLNKWRRNLLQQAALEKKSYKLHEVLWKVIKKYFNSSEVLEFIKHLDVYEFNLLIFVIEDNTEEIKELTWREVKRVLNSNNCTDEKFSKNIERCYKIIENSRQFVDLKYNKREHLKLKWIKMKNPKLFDDNAQLIIKGKLNVKTLEDLMHFMADDSVKNHQILWYHLLTTCTTPEELKNLLSEKDKDGDDFMHLLVIFNKADVIEFTFNKLKENLSESQFKEILKSKGQFGRNLIQNAAINSKQVKTHQILWKLFYNSCRSRKDFLEILKEVDEDENNVYHLGAYFTTGKVFEFMAAELRKLAALKEIKKILSNLGLFNTNLLQSLVISNKQLETHKTVWKIICKYFDAAEVLKFINHFDEDGDNLLCNAVYWNKREIVEFTWNKIKMFITSKDDQVEYLKKVGHSGKNLHQLSLDNQVLEKVALWVQNVMQEYEITL